MKEQNHNLLEILKVLNLYRKKIGIAIIATFIGSIIVSLCLPNYYKGTATFYVASPDQSMPNNIGEEEKDKKYFGSDDDINRLLTVGNSNALANEMIHQFKLYEHYDIDSTNLKAPFKVRKEYDKNYNIKKTKFDAIELSIEDKNRFMVADMANHCRFLIETALRKMITSNSLKQLTSRNENIKYLEEQLNVIGEKLKENRNKFNIFNTTNQTEVLNDVLIKASLRKSELESKLDLAKRTGIGLNKIQTELNAVLKNIKESEMALKNYNIGLPIVTQLENEFEQANNQLSKEKERYKALKATLNTQSAVIIPIEHAATPVIKSSPSRTKIVIAATFVAAVLSIFGALIFHQIKNLDWNE